MASTTFDKVYGPIVDMVVTARWQRLALAYKLEVSETEQTAIDLY